jgi:8-oxo-dGTP diphosphatase
MTKPFNIRVYGLLIHNNQVLVTDEFLMNMEITKFPGGGLEFGEGTIECIIREFHEELNIPIKVEKHFYTTDFFVKSAFNDTQVISIYYIVSTENPEQIITVDKPHQYTDKKNGAQIFRWIPLNKVNAFDFTFVIDQKVAEMLGKLNA